MGSAVVLVNALRISVFALSGMVFQNRFTEYHEVHNPEYREEYREIGAIISFTFPVHHFLRFRLRFMGYHIFQKR
jgi:hypothetical protein